MIDSLEQGVFQESRVPGNIENFPGKGVLVVVVKIIVKQNIHSVSVLKGVLENVLAVKLFNVDKKEGLVEDVINVIPLEETRNLVSGINDVVNFRMVLDVFVKIYLILKKNEEDDLEDIDV